MADLIRMHGLVRTLRMLCMRAGRLQLRRELSLLREPLDLGQFPRVT